MVRKIILFVSAFAMFGVGFMIYQMQEGSAPAVPAGGTAKPLRQRTVARNNTSQPSGSSTLQDKGISFKGASIPAGRSPKFTLFDKQGQERIIFGAAEWKPISDTEFHVNDMDARLRLPGGQLVYVKAEEGQIVVQRTETGNYDPKNGWLKGHVYIIIDRTTPEWRKANPDIAEPDQHPEQVVKMWLDDLRFDLDLAHMETKGPIKLQSTAGSLEGRGLELLWNEVTRRVTMLKIAQGERAVIRGKELAGFSMSGEPAAEESAPTSAPAGAVAAVDPRHGHKAKKTPMTPGGAAPTLARGPDAESESKTKRREAIEFAELDREDEPQPDRVDSYTIEFHRDVLVRQKDGVKVTGSLRADLLRLVADLGQQERAAVEHSPTQSQPAGEKVAAKEKTRRPPAADQLAAQQSTSYLEMTWSGELSLKPLQTVETRPADEQRRFHVVAQGNPVRLMDRKQGEAECRELEYHDETKQVWLRGSPDRPVFTQAGPDRELSGQTVFLDRKAGLARIEGAGKMTDRGALSEAALAGRSPTTSNPSAADDKTASAGKPSGELKEGQATWTKSVEIQFGQVTRKVPNPDGGEPLIKKREYLKKAVFEGDATLVQSGQSISADRIELTFREPEPGADTPADSPTAPESLVAIGHVRMTNGVDFVTCERLEADVAADGIGRPYPRMARAYRNVSAKQGDAEIHARDELIITLTSRPKPVTDEERARYLAIAKIRGIEPGSKVWNDFENKLRNRREAVIHSMTARGGVAARDPKGKLGMSADSLDCAFGDHREITRATVLGTDQTPAYVQTEDFYVRGPQILLDNATQSVDVPGAGLLRFFANQDLNGEAVAEPIPITVTWEQRMAMRGEVNSGTFSGDVRARSQNISLDCKDLRIDFKDLPKEPPVVAQVPTGPDSRWIAGPLVDAFKPRKQETATSKATRQLRKRPSYLHAIGDAVIESRAFDQAGKYTDGLITRTLKTWTPEALLAASKRPAADKSADHRRLASRLRIAGPKIGIDLIQQHLGVEGEGNLLVEDYQIPAPGRAKSTADAATALAGTSAVGALESNGPSQSLFTWKSSLLFLSDRALARFDNRVTMRHASGSKMVLSEAEARGMNFDLSKLGKVGGREATMTCDNLMAQFERRDETQKQAAANRQSGLLARATKLKSLTATGQSVRLEEGNRKAQGTLIDYKAETGIISLSGSSQVPAVVMEWDELGGINRALRNERIEWNQKTGEILVQRPSVIATGQ